MAFGLFNIRTAPTTPRTGSDLVGHKCWVWDYSHRMATQQLVTAYEKGVRFPYRTAGSPYAHASENKPTEDTVAQMTGGFPVGSWVRIVWPGDRANGLVGCVVSVDSHYRGVRIPGFDGHEQEGNCPGGDGWNVKISELTEAKESDVDADAARSRVRPSASAPAEPDFHEMFARMSGLGSTTAAPVPAADPIPTATWDDVKGQDEAKQALKEAVELPRKFSKLYAAYGKKASKGVLLYGAPGCGKTMLGRTLAGTLGCGEAGFRYVKGGELFDAHVGAEEKKIREIFGAAKAFKKKHGVPQIVFFDEADALLPTRRGMSNNSQAGYDFMASTIGAFLTELDGLEECGAFVILATNRPEVIDPAVLRDGRIDRKVHVARPNQAVAESILTSGLSKIPGFDGNMVSTAIEEIYSPKRCYYIAETEDRGAIKVNFHHYISGALLDGIVERTINSALQRDISAESSEPTGIRMQDVLDAVEGSWKSTHALDLQWLLEEVVGPQKINNIRTIHGRYLEIKKGDKVSVEVKHKMEMGDDEI